MTNTIRVTLTPTNVYTRWPCAVCGGWTNKEDVLAEFTDDDGDAHTVCEECLKAGTDRVVETLIAHAERLERWAQELRTLAQREWSMPTFEQWQGANEAEQRERCREIEDYERSAA